MNHPDDISPETILRLRSPYGGWTRAALFRLGVPWPPKKGWRRELEMLWRRGTPRKLRAPEQSSQRDLFSQNKDKAA